MTMVSSASLPGSTYYWVVVADEYQAFFYTRETNSGPLIEHDSLRNEVAREKMENLVSDRGGRAFDSQGMGRHAYDEEKSNLKTHSYAVFAKHIAERIKAGRQTHKFVKLAVVAAPRFLGVLRAALEKTGTEPDLTIDKEVTGRDTAFIQELLDKNRQ
jgi:protein required for attachment to host cells